MPSVPFELEIWDPSDCAAYFKESRQEFLRIRRHKPGFPAELKNVRLRWRAADVISWKPINIPRKACLYRHYNAQGALLYVGISLTALVRTARHTRDSAWFDQVANIAIEHFSSKKEALEAERKAVQTENPRFNVWLKRRG